MGRVITLMTDFGPGAAPAVMKGVILTITPDATLVDISHTIPPQNVREGGRMLNYSAPRFPTDTVHVCVVDPGVGTHRRPIAARFDNQLFVGPDNGLITLLRARAEQAGAPIEIHELNKPQYWLPKVSQTFHGRDIFAPVGAYLARGAPLAEVGSLITDPVLLPIPVMERTAHGLRAEVTNVDAFGNLWINVRDTDLEGLGRITVRVRETEIVGLTRTFGEREPGDLIAYINSEDGLGVAVVNGNAGKRLGAQVGDPVEIIGA